MKHKYSYFVFLLLLTAIVICSDFSVFIPALANDTTHYESPQAKDGGIIPNSFADIPAAQSDAAEESDEDVVYYGMNQIKPEDFYRLTPATVKSPGKAGTDYARLEFPDAPAGSVYSDFIEQVITACRFLSQSVCQRVRLGSGILRSGNRHLQLDNCGKLVCGKILRKCLQLFPFIHRSTCGRIQRLYSQPWNELADHRLSAAQLLTGVAGSAQSRRESERVRAFVST